MINLTTLQCIFATRAAEYARKIGAGVSCGADADAVALAFNYWKIADAQANHGCDITPDTLNLILAHQDEQSLTIQTCC